MKNIFRSLLIIIVFTAFTCISCSQTQNEPVTVPFTLDHNRMLIDGEIQNPDGRWSPVKIWVDTGNPDFFLSEAVAEKIGIDVSQKIKSEDGRIQPLEVDPPEGFRIGRMSIDFTGVHSQVMFQPAWLFSTMHNDVNLPSTVLQKYQVVFDYINNTMTLSRPGSIEHSGTAVPAYVNKETGIIQINASIDKDTLSFAIDNGASYSFASGELITGLSQRNPGWKRMNGAVGCANIWGWWPQESEWPVLRIPEIISGGVEFDNVGIAGLPDFFPEKRGIDDWYSLKTVRPVAGFLGPNAFKNFRMEIDYKNGKVYFKKREKPQYNDMDIVGITLRPVTGGRYQIIGTVRRDGKSVIEGIVPGDMLIQIDDFKTEGQTMGKVFDALRGKPGDKHLLTIQRDNEQMKIEATVENFL